MTPEEHAKRTILLVDDDINLLETLRDLLSYEGYKVVTAASGEEALTALRHIRPEIIILDMSMPGMGGVGFLERITNPDGSTQYPVLVLTARATMAEFFASRQIDGFVTKPCAPDDLLSEVNRIIFLRAGEMARPAALAPDAVGRSWRAVVAEGDEEHNAALCVELQRAGFQVETVYNGAAALELAVMSKPDVLVMRLEMPGMSADEVAATLRRLPGTREVRLVVYGITEPDALIEHVAQLDLDDVAAVKDSDVGRIVSATQAAITRRQAV